MTASAGACDDRRSSDGSGFTVVGVFVRALMLFHVIFPCECLLASWAQDVFLARVFFPVPGCVSGCRECVVAVVAYGVRTWVFFLWGWILGSRGGLTIGVGGSGYGGGDGGCDWRIGFCLDC